MPHIVHRWSDERKNRKQKSSHRIGQAVADAERDARIRNVHDAQYAAEKRRTDCERRYRFYDNIFRDLIERNDEKRQSDRHDFFDFCSVFHNCISIPINDIAVYSPFG